MATWIAGKRGAYYEGGRREITVACGHLHRSREAAEKCAKKRGIDWEPIPSEQQARMPR